MTASEATREYLQILKDTLRPSPAGIQWGSDTLAQLRVVLNEHGRKRGPASLDELQQRGRVTHQTLMFGPAPIGFQEGVHLHVCYSDRVVLMDAIQRIASLPDSEKNRRDVESYARGMLALEPFVDEELVVILPHLSEWDDPARDVVGTLVQASTTSPTPLETIPTFDQLQKSPIHRARTVFSGLCAAARTSSLPMTLYRPTWDAYAGIPRTELATRAIGLLAAEMGVDRRVVEGGMRLDDAIEDANLSETGVLPIDLLQGLRAQDAFWFLSRASPQEILRVRKLFGPIYQDLRERARMAARTRESADAFRARLAADLKILRDERRRATRVGTWRAMRGALGAVPPINPFAIVRSLVDATLSPNKLSLASDAVSLPAFFLELREDVLRRQSVGQKVDLAKGGHLDFHEIAAIAHGTPMERPHDPSTTYPVEEQHPI